jgi:hypothetical protein
MSEAKQSAGRVRRWLDRRRLVLAARRPLLDDPALDRAQGRRLTAFQSGRRLRQRQAAAREDIADEWRDVGAADAWIAHRRPG